MSLSMFLMALGGGGAQRTITLGTLNSVQYSHSTPTNIYFDAWGYDGGNDYYTYATNKGSLKLDGVAEDTYVDGGSNTQTISAMYYTDVPNGYFFFSLDTTSVANTDTTFVSIDANGTVYTRASGNYVASKNGATHWWWSDSAPGTWGGSTSGTFDFTINI